MSRNKKIHFSLMNINLSLYFLFILLSISKFLKAQEITRIIWIGDKDFSYVNFANYSNNDTIIETTSNPGSSKRMFYGLKNNGDYFFYKNGKSTPFYSINSENENPTDNTDTSKFESVNFIAKVKDTNKEYLVSVSMNDQYCELYDFEENNIIKLKSSTFLENEMTNIRGNTNSLIIEGENYIIFPFWSNKVLKIKKYLFNSKNINNNVQLIKTYSKSFSSKTIGNSLSCFLTATDVLTCLILFKGTTSRGYEYSTFNIIALDKNLDEETTGSFTTLGFYPDSFYKCINLKFSVGVFIYYALNKNKNVIFPYFELKYYKETENKIVNYTDKYEETEINYNDVQFNIDSSLNDIVTISTTKICFSTTSENKEILYIILIYLNTNYAFIRYYPIELFNLYNYKFFSDIRIHPYNNLVSLAFSFCQDSNCIKDDDNSIHYSGLMIFGFPNTTDVLLDLTDHSNIDINNIILDFQNNVRIENNIFGLVYKYIEITNMINCDNVSLISTKENTIINSNKNAYNLSEGENIKLKFINDEFYPINCTLKYRYLIIEPEYSVYDSYPAKKVSIYGSDSSSNFNGQKLIYRGKASFYNILLKNEEDKIEKEEEIEEENEEEIEEEIEKEIEEEIKEEEIEEEIEEELKK